VVCTLGICACASPAANLRPAQIGQDEGALFGRVKVFNYQLLVTDECSVIFDGEDGSQKAILVLDSTGWVFTAVTRGSTYFSGVRCRGIDFSVANAAGTGTRELKFDVPGNGTIVYFGDVQIDLAIREPSESVIAGGAIGGLAGAAIAASAEEASREEPVGPSFYVENNFNQAVAEYQGRYANEAKALRPVARIAGGHDPEVSAAKKRASMVPATISPPEQNAAGFRLGSSPIDAQDACEGAGQRWAKAGKSSTCSGTARPPLGAQTTRLQFQDSRLTIVEADVLPLGGDAEAWVAAFRDLQRTIKDRYGAPVEKSFEVPDECKQPATFMQCLGGGKISGSSLWSLEDGTTIRLSIVPDNGAGIIRVRFSGPDAADHHD
jgi:hypothetical protein